MARILVAEDDTAVKSFVSRALTHRGHKVTSVEDGVQALEALDSDSFDLLSPTSSCRASTASAWR